MKNLHINSNYKESTIYDNMRENFQLNLNDLGRTYFPTLKVNLSENLDGNIDLRRILNSYDRFFFKHREKKLFKDMQKIYKIEGFDRSIAYSLFSNGSLAYKLNEKFKIPYYVIVQNTDVNLYFKKVPFSIYKGNKILERATKVIFISEAYKKEVISNYILNKDFITKKSVVIPFGIDFFWEKNTLQQEKKLQDTPRLLFVGKINKNKNLLTLGRVVEELNKEGFKINLKIVGEIEDFDVFDSLQFNQHVLWEPFVHEKENLLDYYRNSDIFIMTSYKESFGLVYGEAMSQGLPVIYSKGQGFDQHFQDGEIGYGVSPDDIEEIKTKIKLIYNNYNQISNSCRLGVSKFYWNNICKEYQQLFENE